MSFYSAFATYYEVIFPFSETVYAFLRRCLPSSGVVLDVGCGTGHYAGQLAADGFAAVGVDLDAAMIAYAQEHYPQAAFQRLNMLDIAALGQTFDAIFCIGNTAAHLTQAQFAHFLDAGRRSLTPGGVWIVQVMNWDYVLTQPAVTFPVMTAGDATFYREYRDISEQQVTFHTRLMVGMWRFSRTPHRFTHCARRTSALRIPASASPRLPTLRTMPATPSIPLPFRRTFLFLPGKYRV